MIESQSIEFGAHAIELGFTYEDGMNIPDGTDPPEVDPLGQDYHPTTRPGHRLPHAWLQSKSDDGTVSTHDLVGSKGSFLLLTDQAGLGWVAAAKRLALRYHIPIETVQIGEHYWDMEDRWDKVGGIKEGGAILVRPDNFVAWRAKGPSTSTGRELEESFAALLGLALPVMVNGDIH